jgi:hypothetical protein
MMKNRAPAPTLPSGFVSRLTKIAQNFENVQIVAALNTNRGRCDWGITVTYHHCISSLYCTLIQFLLGFCYIDKFLSSTIIKMDISSVFVS